jgi:4-hydroxy-2-oxoheptanedioate aldolase
VRLPCTLATATVALFAALPPAPLAAQQRLNPVVELLAARKPVFGLYAPANRRARPGGPALPADSVKSQAQLAQDAVGNTLTDYIFDGSMEGNFDAGYATFVDFAKGMSAAGMLKGKRLTHPMLVKTPEIAPNPSLAAERIAKQLNTGAAGIVFVDVQNADEVKQGLAMMRPKSKGGLRQDDVGGAPAAWGMSEAEYRERADLWPLNPKGELVNFTIVESKEGLAKIREIAAVPGIGVLFPGAGTLRGVFTTQDANGQRVFDEKGWEAAIQSVLAACKEFKVACGFPANDPATMEMRLKQGFSVFVIGWGESGFRTVEAGRKARGQ